MVVFSGKLAIFSLLKLYFLSDEIDTIMVTWLIFHGERKALPI